MTHLMQYLFYKDKTQRDSFGYTNLTLVTSGGKRELEGHPLTVRAGFNFFK